MPQKYTRAQSTSTPISISGRIVGRVRDGVFCKTIRTNHFLRTPPAIAFERSTLTDAEAAGATSVYILHQETGDEYRLSLADVRRYAFPVNRGWGDQVGVVLSRWSINGQPPVAERKIETQQRQPEAAQLGLFGGAA